MTRTVNCSGLEISFCPYCKPISPLYTTKSDWDLQGFCIKVNKYNFNWHSTHDSLFNKSPKHFTILKQQSLTYQACLLAQEIKVHVSRQKGQQFSFFRWPVQGVWLQFAVVLTFSHSYSFTNTLYWMNFLQLKKVDVHLKRWAPLYRCYKHAILTVSKNTDGKKNKLFFYSLH